MTDSLVLEPTTTAQWQTLVREAGGASHHRLDETLESYLVHLLMRFTGEAHFASRVMAFDYLQGSLAQGREREQRLRDVGDCCLITTGLFPARAERCRVRLSYYVQLGRSAYWQLAQARRNALAELFSLIAEGFVHLMEVLQAMRTHQPPLDLLQAVELYQDCAAAHPLVGRIEPGRIMPVPAAGRRH
jgi:hypothetical protein